MACRICDHTMQCLSDDCFWCPRCGTIKHRDEYESPAIVKRVAALRNKLPTRLKEEARILGIDEAIDSKKTKEKTLAQQIFEGAEQIRGQCPMPDRGRSEINPRETRESRERNKGQIPY